MTTATKLGPLAYQNWHAASAFRCLEVSETPVYSDTVITGEVTSGCGPYQFINTISGMGPGGCQPRLVLRSSAHLRYDHSPFREWETDTSRFHGGTVSDEITALLSLELGVRLRCSSPTRYFSDDGDRFGRPRTEVAGSIPTLTRPANRRSIVPTLPEASLQMSLLPTYPSMEPSKAVALARAARLYQSALWNADLDPNSSWLALVSAVEVVAVAWRTDGSEPVELLRQLAPDIFATLEKGSSAVLREIAPKLAPMLKATTRFVSFLQGHVPSAPWPRPPSGAIEWTKSRLRDPLRRVYDHRSRALHDGTPFPIPMCEAPTSLDNGSFSERPFGLGTKTADATWLEQDVPMNLFAFTHLVRGAICKWWAENVETAGATPAS